MEGNNPGQYRANTEGQYRMLNITAGLRKVIYDINPNHLYCPYKAAFEKWALQVLADEENAHSTARREPSQPTTMSKTSVVSQPAIPKSVSAAKQSCSLSYKSGLEGWHICPSYHDLITLNPLPKNPTTQPTTKRSGRLPSIPNYIATKSNRHKLTSPRNKDVLNRRAQTRVKNSPQPQSVSSTVRIGEEAEEMEYMLKMNPRQKPCRLCNYAFKIGDSPSDNMKRYRKEYTYATLPFKSSYGRTLCSPDDDIKLSKPPDVTDMCDLVCVSPSVSNTGVTCQPPNVQMSTNTCQKATNTCQKATNTYPMVNVTRQIPIVTCQSSKICPMPNVVRQKSNTCQAPRSVNLPSQLSKSRSNTADNIKLSSKSQTSANNSDIKCGTIAEMLDELGVRLNDDRSVVTRQDHKQSTQCDESASSRGSKTCLLPYIAFDGGSRKCGQSRLSDSILFMPDIGNKQRPTSHKENRDKK